MAAERRTTARPCWCGNVDLEWFSDDYRVCPRCATLVSTFEHDGDVTRVRTDEVDLYGKDYWFGHMEKDLGFPNIFERARTDLVERCPYWLKALLRYKLPPARALELGSAHGGFVATLRWAGYDATGLELSPAIAKIGRDLFHVPVLHGPVEDQAIDAGSLDVIVMMDVLEHLPSPAQTMAHAISLLKPDGLLLLQTPCYPEGLSFAMLEEQGHRFLEMLKHNEHLYLFSARSVVRFFAELGCQHVSFEPALFGHYDMFLVASRQPLVAEPEGAQEEAVIKADGGRLVVALLDLYARERDITARFLQADRDRTDRLAAISKLEDTLRVSEADRQARLAAAETLSARLAEAEADCQKRLETIETLTTTLHESEHDRRRRLQTIEQLTTRLAEAEDDRAGRLRMIETLTTELAVAEADRVTRLVAIEDLSTQLAASDADRAARLSVIETLTTELAVAEADRATRLVAIEELSTQLAASDADRAARLSVIENAQDRLTEAAAERRRLLARIDELSHELETRVAPGRDQI